MLRFYSYREEDALLLPPLKVYMKLHRRSYILPMWVNLVHELHCFLVPAFVSDRFLEGLHSLTS